MERIASFDKEQRAFSLIQTLTWWSGLERWWKRERNSTSVQRKGRADKEEKDLDEYLNI